MGWSPEKAAAFTADLPHRPGVYIMRDRAGRVIYIGKAGNLHSRVSQYFRESGDTRPFVAILSEVLYRLETVVTATEKEALILENELIKKHRPPFNVLLKDDKAYLYLRLDPGAEFPRLELSRKRRDDGALYFGPSHSAQAIRQTHLMVTRHFGLRTCADAQFASRRRPCIEWQMKRCAGPCCKMVTREGYRERVDAAILFLKGRYQEVLKALTAGMKAAAAAEDFEEAARLRDQVRAVQDALSRQSVVLPGTTDVDAIGMAAAGDLAVVMILRFESGVLRDQAPLVLDNVVAPVAELLESVLLQFYSRTPVPAEILVPDHVGTGTGDDRPLEALESLLAARAGRQVLIRTPKRGRSADALRMANDNAAETLRAAIEGAGSRKRALERLAATLGLDRPPTRIEGFDMSQFQSAEPVGSMVVMTDGRLDKKCYRTFSVKWESSRGDTGFMTEVLSRRLADVGRSGDGSDCAAVPDLIMLDGGPSQLMAARAVLDNLGLRIPLVALAKSRVVAMPGSSVSHTPERLFVPADSGAPESPGLRQDERAYFSDAPDDLCDQARMLVPSQNDPGLHLLMRLRDEAHRFAISFHRKRRNRRGLGSILDGINGLGKKRRTALLRHFRTVAAIRQATLEDLMAVPGIPAAVADAIFDRMHQ